MSARKGDRDRVGVLERSWMQYHRGGLEYQRGVGVPKHGERGEGREPEEGRGLEDLMRGGVDDGEHGGK